LFNKFFKIIRFIKVRKDNKKITMSKDISRKNINGIIKKIYL